MNTIEIGVNAGIVWKVLEKANGRMTIDQIVEESGLNRESVVFALGWLAREDKVEFTQTEDADYVSLFDVFYF